ncbi:efflux RND transporter periplasmic adaptor subunit [Candidatus Skiveiella danica]|jgi:HlyD family secretion protein|uniref:efflux RND transporter periplasmic adaptor subunit n=1 Tax=Candidatus Skiveiella danica TaxID=3386177 RepID=UPI001DC8B7E9|nr:efflux RND transporter periplasmic adaptor subunit [Betaproteobacteria bacterium]
MNTPTPPVQPAAPVPAVKPATAKPATADIQALLGTDQPARWWARPSLWIGLAVLAAAAGGIYFWQAQKESNAAPVYVTEALRKGNLTLTVAANGTIVPTRVVSIGSELSGTVKRVLVDVNDVVKKGQVLVELDTAKLDDQVLRSRAALASAQAQLAQTNATVKEARAGLARFEEVSRLSGGKVPSATELDGARATLERAVAGEASASATVAEARATLSTDETNLSKASIRSPINGVVLTRTVDPGNAVAASLQAVTLFTIAEDLAQLRLEVAVDEADVGAVKVGQKASFTVSAYPSRRYPARITRVAFGSTKTDNVITYTTWLEVDNSDLSLRPGMTAASTIVATERNDVLLVPNTALRFTPATAAGAAPAASGSVVSKLMPRMPPRSGGRRAAGNGNAAVRQIWVLQDGQAVALAVTPGISDGRMTEVSGPELKEGMAVITDQRAAGAAP